MNYSNYHKFIGKLKYFILYIRMKYKKNTRKNKKGGSNENIKYFIISGPDNNRKKLMIDEIKKGGIDSNNITWIEGYNIKDIDDNFRKIICTNDEMQPGEVSVTIKHYLALRNIVNNKIPISVIMEDDITFKENVPDKLKLYLTQLPNDWDILFESDYLSYTNNTVTPDKVVYKKNSAKGGSRGCIFYMIKLKTAELLYNCFLPYNKAIDHYYNDIFKEKNINSYWTQPTNIEHRKNIPSLIGDKRALY